MGSSSRVLILTAVVLSWAPAAAPAGEGAGAPRRGARLFFRALGAQSNAPILPKSRSAWTQDKQVRTGTTGMADEGFTEYPFCFGTMDFTFVQARAYYPRLISGARADEKRVNTADILMDYVYEPDGCVWGPSAREFVQTFTATQPELVSVTMRVASEPGVFRASLLEGGPAGRQIAPSKTFRSGHSMTWGTAVWEAAQAPLAVGRTYGLRIRREDGKAWTPYLHATGSAYDGGLLYVDGRPRSESDLACWIVEQPGDLHRAPIDGADPDGWVYRSRAVTFRPRTPNVRLVSLTVSPVTAKELAKGYCDLVARVRSPEGKVVGGPKRCLAVGPRNGPHRGHFLFAGDELPVVPGTPYRIEVFTVPHRQQELPEPGDVTIVPRDVHARVYGEPQPGKLPGIFNLRTTFESDSRVRFDWSEPLACPTRIESWGLGINNGKQWVVPAGQTGVAIGKFWAGHEYDIRLTSTGPTGLTWRTPLYRLRFPRSDIKPLTQPEYPKPFVTLARRRPSAAPEYGPIRFRRQVAVVNGDFEEALAGWKADGTDRVYTAGSQHDVGVKWGQQMAGWSVLAGAKQRKQVFAVGALSQRIATTPGHAYVLSAWAHTSVANGPRGDTRVRLLADPAGGSDFEGANASQWYSTDGRWMRFQHRWIARADHSTIALGLFRWRDLDRASVYVDHVTVYDLGPSPAEATDGVARAAAAPSLVLRDAKVEADDKVEAHLVAPPGYVITGLGARAHYDNVTTMWLRIQPLRPDGTLGEPEQLRGGWEPDAGLEAAVELPEGHVVTGFGARAAPEWDVKSLVVWARPMSRDGRLGEEKAFRAGKEPEKGPERHARAAAGRVLTAAGLNCMHNDINGIRATSAALVRTSSAEARGRPRPAKPEARAAAPAAAKDGLVPIEPEGVFVAPAAKAHPPVTPRRPPHPADRVRCRLVDFVDCSKADHDFAHDSKSRLRAIGGLTYRLTDGARKMSWFEYTVRTAAKPGRPHLLVARLASDRERYTTISLTMPKDAPWAAPYAGEEKHVAGLKECQEPDGYHPGVGGGLFTGREYPLEMGTDAEGRLYYAMLFYPGSARTHVTISHEGHERRDDKLNGAAVHAIWVYEVTDDLAAHAVKADEPANLPKRRIGIYQTHPWYFYGHYGCPARTVAQRRRSLTALVDYLRFCGFNYVEFNAVNGSDRTSRAWYDSAIFEPLIGDLLKELVPLAGRRGVDVLPVVTSLKPPKPPERFGFGKDSWQVNADGKAGKAFGSPVPDPLRPEVREMMGKLVDEIASRCAKQPNVVGVGVRVNGKIGLCYVGDGLKAGYSKWNLAQFAAEAGVRVPAGAGAHDWLRKHAWEKWLDWRCRRTRELWLALRDRAAAHRKDLRLVMKCDLPSETPGTNVQWPAGVEPLELLRGHGYDPRLFHDDDGIVVQRGMMIGADRFFGRWGGPYGSNAQAYKTFHHAPGLMELYRTRAGAAVELYHNYWEEGGHVRHPEFGPQMRTATLTPPGRGYFEAACASLRRANVHTIAFMGWARASIGHEAALRRWCRAFRALPAVPPRPFGGRVEPDDPRVWVRRFGPRLCVLNDSPKPATVRLTFPGAPGRVVDLAPGRAVPLARGAGGWAVTLDLDAYDLRALDAGQRPS